MTQEILTATTTITASAEDIFAVLAGPRKACRN